MQSYRQSQLQRHVWLPLQLFPAVRLTFGLCLAHLVDNCALPNTASFVQHLAERC